VASLPTEKAWPKSERESLDANLEEFSNDEMPKLVEDNGGAENENEG
jgi:hypothetical protein